MRTQLLLSPVLRHKEETVSNQSTLSSLGAPREWASPQQAGGAPPSPALDPLPAQLSGPELIFTISWGHTAYASVLWEDDSPAPTSPAIDSLQMRVTPLLPPFSPYVSPHVGGLLSSLLFGVLGG